MHSTTRRVFLSGVLGLLLVAVPVSQTPAAMVDLTSAGASGSIGNAFFVQVDTQPTGTGFIDSFVRLQKKGVEHGFNTDYRPLGGDLADVNSSPQFTHSIRLSDFGTVDWNGTGSYRFLLDINEKHGECDDEDHGDDGDDDHGDHGHGKGHDSSSHGGGHGDAAYLSLDELRIYVAADPAIASLSDLASQGTLIYDLDAAGDNWIWLDASLNHGSGSGDMFAYLPADLFQGMEDGYLYLYSKFGLNYAADGGFEEWARVDAGPPAVPEPATLLLLGGGLAGLAWRRRREG